MNDDPNPTGTFRPEAAIPTFTRPPSITDLEALADRAFATIPEVLRTRIRNIVIQVEDFPDEETEREMELETPFDILGLYRGVALPRRSILDTGALGPDLIYLYRRPLLDEWCESGEDLAHLVRHVLIHEIGHHFGFSDEEMEELERSGP